jgi:proline iminopeptidase
MLLDHLGEKTCMLYGGSWGSTLALCYAISNPQRVTKILMSGIFLARDFDMEYFHFGSRNHFPKEWERMISLVPVEHRQDYKSIIAYYASMFDDNDALIKQKYLYEWELKPNNRVAFP